MAERTLKKQRTPRTAPPPIPHEIVGPGVRALLEWAKAQGVITDAHLVAASDKPGLGIGAFRPARKDMAVMAASPNEGNYTVVHELLHAITGAGLPSRTNKAAQEMEKLTKGDQAGVVLPRHWVRGAVDNPLQTPRRVMDKPNRIKDAVRASNERRLGELRQSMDPNVWIERSGIKPAGQPGSRDDYEEAHAYYFTDPQMNPATVDERAKEAGMFLLDVGVPMQVVEPVVAELSQTKADPEGPRWSGGSRELLDVLNQRAKNTALLGELR